MTKYNLLGHEIVLRQCEDSLWRARWRNNMDMVQVFKCACGGDEYLTVQALYWDDGDGQGEVCHYYISISSEPQSFWERLRALFGSTKAYTREVVLEPAQVANLIDNVGDHLERKDHGIYEPITYTDLSATLLRLSDATPDSTKVAPSRYADSGVSWNADLQVAPTDS